MTGVPVRRIAPVRLLKGSGKGVNLGGSRDQMHVVGHEAIAQKRESVKRAILPEKIEIHEPIRIGMENESPRICALSNMVRHIHRNHSSQTSHEERQSSRKTRKHPVCPSFPPVFPVFRFSPVFPVFRPRFSPGFPRPIVYIHKEFAKDPLIGVVPGSGQNPVVYPAPYMAPSPSSFDPAPPSCSSQETP